MRSELPARIYARITQLCHEGNSLADSDSHKDAWLKFVEALQLVPDPKTEWEATTWILASIGDMAFALKSYDQGRDALEDAVMCPGGLENPFIMMRLGQCYFELGDEKRAADRLARAYFLDGRTIFGQEDPKYFGLLEKVLRPPAGHDRLP